MATTSISYSNVVLAKAVAASSDIATVKSDRTGNAIRQVVNQVMFSLLLGLEAKGRTCP